MCRSDGVVSDAQRDGAGVGAEVLRGARVRSALLLVLPPQLFVLGASQMVPDQKA